MAELLDISVLNDISAFWPQSEQIKSHIQGIESYFVANKHACLDCEAYADIITNISGAA